MTAVDRRNFLQAGATAASLAAVRAAYAHAPSNQLNFAVVGPGRQGLRDLTNMLEVPGTRLAAICEINPANVAEVRKVADGFQVYEDWNDMLATEQDLDAVIIALPEHTHAPCAIACMQAGKDVFCEKPMAYSLEQARDMIQVRDRTDRVLQIGQQRRSNPLYYLAERLINKDGIIGEVMRADAFWDRWTDWKRELPEVSKDFTPWGFPSLNHLVNWRLYREYGHGLMTENGTHQLDACGWLMGGRRPMRVCGLGTSRYRDGRETHDIVSAEYMYEGDVIVRFTQDFHQGFNYRWGYGELLMGTEGSLRITETQELAVYDQELRETKISIRELGDIELGGIVSTQQELVAVEENRKAGGLSTYSVKHEMRIFAHAVRHRTPVTCTAEIGLNSIVPTIVGTESQLAGEYRTFDPGMFA